MKVLIASAPCILFTFIKNTPKMSNNMPTFEKKSIPDKSIEM